MAAPIGFSLSVAIGPSNKSNYKKMRLKNLLHPNRMGWSNQRPMAAHEQSESRFNARMKELPNHLLPTGDCTHLTPRNSTVPNLSQVKTQWQLLKK